MYEYRPQHTNNRARMLVLGLAALAASALISSAFVPKYPFILQSLGLLLLLPTVQLLTRFVVTQYLYRITPYESGEVDLEIFAYRGGNKKQLVCRVGLEEITAVTPLSAQNKKPQNGVCRYNYCPDLAPERAGVLSITNADGDCEILFSPDEKLTAIIEQAIRQSNE